MEGVLSKILVVLLKHVSIRSLLENKIRSVCLETEKLESVFLPYMSHYSDTELRHILCNVEDKYSGNPYGDLRGLNFFRAVFDFADQILVEQENEVLCRYTKMLRWRSITVQVAEETFVMAYMAKRDVSRGVQRKCFAHKPVIGHNNMQLKAILDSGMSENHFHLMGSAPYFQLSWIQLMNDLSDNVTLDRLRRFETRRRNVNINYNETYIEESFETRVYQAFLIRLYFFSRLSGKRLKLGVYRVRGERLELRFDSIPEVQKYVITKKEFLEKCKEKTLLEVFSHVLGKQRFEVFRRNNYELYDFMMYIQEETVCMEALFEKHDEINLLQLLEFYVKNREWVELERCKGFMNEDIYNRYWDEKTLFYVKDLLQNPYRLKLKVQELQVMVRSIKGLDCPEKNDYALALSEYEWYENHGRYSGLWGERCFLYLCFREIYKTGYLFSVYESNLFHAYLIIKETIRGELVQSNKYVGFENFHVYQDRKCYFLDEEGLYKSMARMAVRDTLQSQPIVSLEARISPETTAKLNYENIRFYDHAIDEEGKFKNRFYYVLHFIKTLDEEYPRTKSSEDDIGVVQTVKSRHYRKRRDIEKRAFALKNFREWYPNTASRVLGIDAASQEIGCRPEVFATAFRSLKRHTFSYGHTAEKILLPQLRISYHVGEDFLDVVDGLRAIEEAVLFLGMDCGDRLGHALALGINVNEWYASKNYNLSIPAQDYLDNIVWLYYAITRYQIKNMDNLKSILEEKFSYYFQKIYGASITQKNMSEVAAYVREKNPNEKMMDSVYCLYNENGVSFSFDIHTYYLAWQLRGDSPELYKMGYYDRKDQSAEYSNMQRVNLSFPEDFSIRYMPGVAYLYYLYHYAPKVKEEGKKEVRYKADRLYMEGVAAVQQEMQQEIARRGIGIETNPSSNYLIGTFKRYAKHPIINFYNLGLVTDEEKLRKCPQICSSINTDDQGVFSASLENEYALMAVALEKECDEKGQYLYNKTMIYEWLDNIRKNGNRQAFGLEMRKKMEDGVENG